jgi:hypothetical protein
MSIRKDAGPEGLFRKDASPDGVSNQRDLGGPDGFAKPKITGEDDVEGHSMMINPSLGRDLAKARSEDIERGVRGRQHEAEAKRPFRK